MKKLTKTQLKKIARMHAAASLLATESCWAFDGLNLSREEIQYLDNQFEKLAYRLLNGEPSILYNSNEIVNYIRTKK